LKTTLAENGSKYAAVKVVKVVIALQELVASTAPSFAPAALPDRAATSQSSSFKGKGKRQWKTRLPK
jgi:hypothetical protein